MTMFAKSQPERTDFAESHSGKYFYHRRGLLDSIPYRKLTRGVIVLRSVDLNVVVEFLKDNTIEIHIREIKLSKYDRELLQTDTLQ